MRIGIIGAGIAGLSAAYDLLQAGHEITIYEAADHAGGLASGFQDALWDWPLEKFYHHIFKGDTDIIGLVEELGMADTLFFPRPTTSVIYDGEIVPFDSPLRWIMFPGFNLLDVARFGLVSAYLRFTKPWRKLEQETADSWLRKWYGDKIYETTWRPMLIGKFGPYYQDVNMAWMWARLHVRSPKLGYFVGGFQAFVDALVTAVTVASSVTNPNDPIHYNTPVTNIKRTNNQLTITTANGQTASYDQVLSTTSPRLMSQLAPDLPRDYLGQLLELKSMGAVVMTLALKRPLLPDNQTYWLNIPADSPDKSQNDIPFLALVEHTNYVSAAHYGGDTIVYCGDYVAPDHAYFQKSKEELAALFLEALTQFNPKFKKDWVRQSWLFREQYAQPVPLLNHSGHIPDTKTPIPGLFFASMSQVYPWDRGTNYAVQIGRKVAQQMGQM
ncbi:MAG: oxidoreductase [Chloroflexi bacterium]|nr:MAG: oxidoreductase [Chloroflexota bacterium]